MKKKVIVGLFSASMAMSSISAQAVILNMTTSGDSEIINGALLQTTAPNDGAGSGSIDAFLRTQATNYEKGFNTDATVPTTGMDQVSGVFTHSLQLGDLAVLEIGSSNYYLFALDINEDGTDGGLLTLQELQIFANDTTGSAATYGDLGTLAWDMDGAGDTQVTMQNGVGGSFGSGNFDYFLLLDVGLFSTIADSDYVYLYNEFGNAAATDDPYYHSDGGFEEWAAYTTTVVPVPAAVWLFGSGLIGLIGVARRKKV